jgi:predicted adenylyl cyclase CyaB
MSTNIEIKAKIQNFKKAKLLTKSISETPEEIIFQVDTFFRSPKGRLKLRTFRDGSGELIYYERKNVSAAKKSEYFIYPTDNPDGLKQILSASLGIRGTVRKRRHLYRVGNTRIHLDSVASLGDFLELEVVLDEHQTDNDGKTIAEELMKRLNIDAKDLIDVAYIDLLEKRDSQASKL